MFEQMTLFGTINATSSQASADGVSRSDSQDGPTIDPSGPARVRASRSAGQARALGPQTPATSGPTSPASSASERLASSLASRLTDLMAGHGSTAFALTWRDQATPSGLRLCVLRARALHTSGSGFTGSLPTPVASEHRDVSRPVVLAKCDRGGRLARWICARSAAARMWPEPVTLNPSFARHMMGYPAAWDDCAGTGTP